MRHAVLAICGLGLLVASSAGAESIAVREGNIVLIGPGGSVRQLTDSGLDFSPSLSPDGTLVAFARHTPGVLVWTGLGEVEAGEIWIVQRDGRNARRLARGAELVPWEDTLAGLSDPQFLSDNRRVLMQSRLWATSDKISIVDIETGEVKRLLPGQLEAIIREGKYRDHLIVNQHRYFLGSGSYDWYWLFDANGNEIGPIGYDESQVATFKEMHVPGYRRPTPGPR